MIIFQHTRHWLLAILILIVFSMAACGAGETVDSAPVPEIEGPALIFFYTDG